MSAIEKHGGHWGTVTGAAESCPDCGGAMPPVFIAAGDLERLRELAAAEAAILGRIASFLVQELERAKVVERSQFPADAVAMNDRVLFRLNDRPYLTSRTLVFPERYEPTDQYLSILSPVGVALLGLKKARACRFACETAVTAASKSNGSHIAPTFDAMGSGSQPRMHPK